jgi:hypothetical protein
MSITLRVLVRARRVVAEIEDIADVKRARAGLRLQPQRIADLQLQPLA